MVKPVTTLAPFMWLSTAAAETSPASTDFGIGGTEASKGLTALFAGIILIALVPLLFFAVRKILRYLRSRREKSFIEELTLEAVKREKAGEFVSAGLAYEKLKKPERAAELYEKGGDFIKAADAYESMGRMEKVGEMYEKAGDLRKAADTRMYFGDFPGAARLYNQLGDKRRAAEALENSGSRLAAARAYREAKDYLKASGLLKDAGLDREAAEMYAISLAGAGAAESNLDKFYAYASLLETAGDPGKAAEVLRMVSEVDPDYRDVRQRLEALGVNEGPRGPEVTAEPGEEPLHETSAEETPGGETTLRGLIRAGGMEPRHSFRLWVQILKALDQGHKEGGFPESLTPEGILIDSRNNIRFSENTSKDFAYIAPEVVSGSPPDAVSSVYSMGVILYEMLTGSLDHLGIKRPAEVVENVPPWLEELTLKCCERKREARYQGPDEIFSLLVDLKKKMQE
jgi:tetratricopeptide (TPR) repeat protein